MIGRLVDISRGIEANSYRITFETNADVREMYNDLKGKPVNAEYKAYRPRRSLDANAYFHVLVNQIARKLGETDPEPPTDDDVKRRLVMSYGTVSRYESGGVAGAILPVEADPLAYHPYPKEYKRMEVGGRECVCYMFYKPTHEMDSKEMAQLIDGTIAEANALGIPTDPQEAAKVKESWGRR